MRVPRTPWVPAAATLGLCLGLAVAACGGGEAPAPPVEREAALAQATTDPAARPAIERGRPPEAAAPSPQTEAAEHEPRQSAAERRAQEVAALLAAANIEEAAPGQLTIVLDPGHGGPDEGGALNGVAEITSNLDFALRVEEILVANGFHVVLTRRDTGLSVLGPPSLETADPRRTRPDRLARVELAEAVGADVFVSLHSNGHPDWSVRGLEAWYHPSPHLGDANLELGSLILGRIHAELTAYGYEPAWRGVHDDTCWQQRGNVCRSLAVLSPPLWLSRTELEAFGVDPADAGLREGQRSLYTRGTRWPAVLVELLFVSNPADAAVLRDFQGRQAIARGVAQGIMDFLERSGRAAGGAAASFAGE